MFIGGMDGSDCSRRRIEPYLIELFDDDGWTLEFVLVVIDNAMILCQRERERGRKEKIHCRQERIDQSV